MKIIKLIVPIALMSLIVWSCSDSISPENSEGFASAPYANAKQISVSANNTNQADSSNQLNKLIPGFGGMFINQSGQFTIYLTHPATQKAKAKEVLSNSEPIKKALARIRAEGQKYQSASVANINIKKGQYTFIQLQVWENKIVDKVSTMDGFYGNGIDQSKNKVSIGVKDREVKNKIIKRLVKLNIPKNAIMIYKTSPAIEL
jgi:hypothetical protein